MSRPLTLIPGGGGVAGQVRPTAITNMRTRPRMRAQVMHPSLYDWAQDTTTTCVVPLSPLEWSLIHQALAERGQGNSLRPGSVAHAELAVKVRDMVRGQVVHDTDPTPAHGLPRPGGAA